MESIYSKFRIIAAHPPFFFSFRFDVGEKDVYIGVEGHFRESSLSQQILTISSELEVISHFMSKASAISDKFDSMIGGYVSAFGEGRASYSLSCGSSIG